MSSEYQDQKKHTPSAPDETPTPVPESLRTPVAEAVLFSAGESVAVVFLAQILGLDESATVTFMDALAAKYDQEMRGMRILRVGEAYQMTSRPVYYPYIGQMYASKAANVKLTETQLETLAIIAYRQPVTKLEIEDIRGVHSDAVVNRLVEYGLVEEKGRLKAPGRPVQFGTSQQFLKYFGFEQLDELPHLSEVQREEREKPLTQMDLADLELIDETQGREEERTE